MSTNRHREIARRIADVACSYEHKIPDAEDKIEAILQEYFGTQVKSFDEAARQAATLIHNAGQGYPVEYMETNIRQAFQPLADLNAKLVKFAAYFGGMADPSNPDCYYSLPENAKEIFADPIVAAAIRAGE